MHPLTPAAMPSTRHWLDSERTPLEDFMGLLTTYGGTKYISEGAQASFLVREWHNLRNYAFFHIVCPYEEVSHSLSAVFFLSLIGRRGSIRKA